MSGHTSIQWTDATWNPVTGCTAVSPGCANCYAAKLTATRLKAQPKYAGLAVLNNAGMGVFTGEVRIHPDELKAPLHWREPRRVFVNSMSDTFHREVKFEVAAAIFGIAAACPHHTFQILTKRPERMLGFFEWIERNNPKGTEAARCRGYAMSEGNIPSLPVSDGWDQWPIPNVWIGTSVENLNAGQDRVPFLKRCPAAKRFLSVEPILGPTSLLVTHALRKDKSGKLAPNGIDWVIVGGESAQSGARQTNIAWIREVVTDCREAGVPVFVKQLGTKPYQTREGGIMVEMHLEHPKGGEPDEWPADLRVREFPT